MSEYWISPPHFGTMSKNNSVVHTPRNVELPIVSHSDNESLGKQRKKKLLCLSIWTLGLVLLTGGAIVMAHYLIPEDVYNHPETTNDEFKQVQTCPDLLPLEDKVKNSELIIVAQVLNDGSLQVDRVLKGSDDWVHRGKIQKGTEICFDQNQAIKQVFFLASQRQGRSLEQEFVLVPTYQTILASSKIIEIVELLINDNGFLDPVNDAQQVQELNKGVVCSLADEKECHQIDHCQLVIGGGSGDQCICQDRDDCQDGEGEPVCGSDHVTYRDSCQLKNAACGKRLNITQISDVPCEDAGLCGVHGCPYHAMCLRDPNLGKYACQCPDCYAGDLPTFVCGTDGITYRSLCHLQQASCLLKKTISFDYEGQCKKCPECPFQSTCHKGHCKCPQKCPSNYEPVCGTDGQTYNNQCWMMQQTCHNDKIVEVQSKGKCPHPSRSCQEHESCKCPQGVDGQNCDKCLPGFWAFTSFGCLDCGCTVMGSLKGKCDEFTGKCECKSGFSGDKCEICPDGSKALLDGCPNRSTKFKEPLACGSSSCDYGATCVEDRCLCKFDCKNNKDYFQSPVCGRDGNTYRSECQLRQYSCRVQQEIVIVKYEPCTDAPHAVYGADAKRQDILSDGTGTVMTVYGLIGDQCLDDRDCFIDDTTCFEGVCTCQPGFKPTASNLTCLEHRRRLCDPNPCKDGGTCEEHDGTFTCYCPPGLAGTFCQHDVTKTTVNVASFTGESNIGLVTPDDVVNRFDIDFKFRTFGEEGVLLYAQGSQDNDFISLCVLNGHIEFRYDLGSGTLVLRSTAKVKLGQWQTVVARRYNQDGFLSLDEDKVTGQAVGSIKTLNIDKVTWMGGIPHDMKLDAREKAGTSTGFIGCIKDVELARKPLSIQSEYEPKITTRKNIVECNKNPCSRMPCENEGSCQALDQGFRCQCKPNYTGHQCQRLRDSCHPNPCQNHGSCRMDDLKGFLCQCAPGHVGRLCEKSLFTDDGKRFRKSLEHDGKEKIHFNFQIKHIVVGDIMNVDAGQENLQLGLTESGSAYIELFGTKLVHPMILVPFSWYKLSIIKQHHRLSLKVDDVSEHMQILESWPKFSFQNEQLNFTNAAQKGQVCLQNFHIVRWNHGRKSKTISKDICK